jgi:hypothetical protein
MNKKEVISALRSQRGKLPASELAELVFQTTGGMRRSLPLLVAFAEAFPSIPSRTVTRAALWSGFEHGTMSNDQFDQLFSPWLDVATAD